MNKLSITGCQRALEALDAADQLTDKDNVSAEIERFKAMDMKDVMFKATKALFSENLSPEALGLPSNFFAQLEQLAKLNNVARSKYREHIQTNLSELSQVQDVNGGEHE
ncbi:hypothetical protein BOO91_16865 [Vibrio navarrensis]|uniref:Uncharacterized protein n=1 Tax=Vibrio navarrensis TaxID=29495 RepID=A0AAJ4LWI8_9VIBR|nr:MULTISPECIES: hypothetical protein [Vibrio]KJR28939.1 hypothetical protein UF06_13545 [Vibrio sp. S234-5]MBE3658263.1 hypothetical protein [Vibrio navarrensis]MBE3662611.1 hypothetical protein [Vibrio navarrensis]MBE4602584.1 hypothetical protein [Vibrio navarrensis]QPL55900.1 hypothetical protein I3X05_17400 [Vibrio navarrensis]